MSQLHSVARCKVGHKAMLQKVEHESSGQKKFKLSVSLTCPGHADANGRQSMRLHDERFTLHG